MPEENEHIHRPLSPKNPFDFAGMADLKKISLGDESDAQFLARLLEDVCEGRLEPGDADERAVNAGHFPFSQRYKTPDIWNPMSPMWTLEMVVSWIVWGDRELTLRQVASSYQTAKIWMANINLSARHPFALKKEVKGYRLVALGPTSIFSSFLGYDGKYYSFGAQEDWFPSLSAYLRYGKLNAGARDLNGNFVNVPGRDWADAKFVDHETGAALEVDGTIKYTHLEFLHAEVRKLYSEKASKPNALRRWKTPPPIKDLNAYEEKALSLLQSDHEYKEGVPWGKAHARNEKLEKRLKEKLKLEGVEEDWPWSGHYSFARFVDRLLEKVCEEDSTDRRKPGRPRKRA